MFPDIQHWRLLFIKFRTLLCGSALYCVVQNSIVLAHALKQSTNVNLKFTFVVDKVIQAFYTQREEGVWTKQTLKRDAGRTTR